MDTCIVVPCFDEAERLRLAEFRRFADTWSDTRFLFVNDGSSAGTGEMLAEAARASDAIELLELERNSGKAEAVRRGVLAALDDSPCYVGFWDADLATPLDAIPELVAVLEERPELEMVFGSRVKLLGRTIERRPLRHCGGRVFAIAASRVLDLPIYDTQCGAKLFRASPRLASLFAEPFLTRWVFDVELIARLARQRRADGPPTPAELIYEYPLREWRDIPGSKVGVRDFARSLVELWRIRRHYR